MSETIEIEVGNIYANLHEQFSDQIGEQYDARIRQEIEEFIHNFNQQVERAQEQQAEQIEQIDDVEEDAVNELVEQ